MPYSKDGTNTAYDNNYLSGEKLYRFLNYNIWDKIPYRYCPTARGIEMVTTGSNR
jgi:hypothetical protein